MTERNEQNALRNFIFNCMTQAELALDGQDPARMAEALRSILQGAYDVHSQWQRGPLPMRGDSLQQGRGSFGLKAV